MIELKWNSEKKIEPSLRLYQLVQQTILSLNIVIFDISMIDIELAHIFLFKLKKIIKFHNNV